MYMIQKAAVTKSNGRKRERKKKEKKNTNQSARYNGKLNRISGI